jgi:AcrR family transcriptional regulator
MSAVERQRRPGGRSAQVRRSVHDATLELLAERGYEGFEIPEVAARAGVHRTTVYRRWQTKSALVVDTMLRQMEEQVPAPNTGALRSDLEQLLREVVVALSQPVVMETLRAQVAMATHDEHVRLFWATRFERSGVIVERAIARGELPAGTDAREFQEAAIAPLYLRALVTGGPVDDALIERVASRTLAAFGATPAQSSSPKASRPAAAGRRRRRASSTGK